VLKESMRLFQKTDAIDGKRGAVKLQKDLLPKYYVNSESFESIFE
jgi:hypothetical protein